MLLAIAAAVGHRLVVFALHRIDRATITTDLLIALAVVLEELVRRVLIQKLLEDAKVESVSGFDMGRAPSGTFAA